MRRVIVVAMSMVKDKICAVTGAGSGIGRALAIQLGRRGARAVAISDVNETGLAVTAAAVQATGAGVHRSRLDVSDRDAMLAWASELAQQFGVVHQIYNNAGVADSGTIEEFGYDDYRRVLDINLWGVIHGTKAFLPHLMASGDGHVVNVSSLNGIMAQAELSAYCASKFAVRGFTETLAIEMAEARRPVRATVVHPGGVKTNIASAALATAEAQGRPVSEAEHARASIYNEKLLKLDAGRAAEIIVDAVEHDRPRVMVGRDAQALDLLVRTTPRHWPRLVAPAMRRMLRASHSK
jgi:NAD(P)-dependent dehydrogenase (short-subunit alcohol dehydrogenase family)